MRHKIITATNFLTLRKAEITRCKIGMKQIIKQSKKEAENTITNYYKKLSRIIHELEKQAHSQLDSVCEAQYKAASTYNVRLKD